MCENLLHITNQSLDTGFDSEFGCKVKKWYVKTFLDGNEGTNGEEGFCTIGYDAVLFFAKIF